MEALNPSKAAATDSSESEGSKVDEQKKEQEEKRKCNSNP